MLFTLQIFWLLSSSASAQESCWQQEVNPYTKSLYTQNEWQDHVEKWEEHAPSSPSLWSLFKAHQTYKKELSAAEKLKNDKKKHCYLGCRIAQNTSFDVSTYVGWLKESEDLNDCDINTNFEPLDFASTVDGAAFAETNSSPISCFEFCQDYKAPQKRSEL